MQIFTQLKALVIVIGMFLSTQFSVAGVNPLHVTGKSNPRASAPANDQEDNDQEDNDEDEIWQVNGSIVLQYNSSRSSSGKFGTDPYALLGLTLTPNEQLEFYTLLFQGRDFEFDEAFATWHVFQEDKLDVSFGRQYLPFGAYDSGMVSDPLTQILGNIRGKEVLKASTQLGDVWASLYTFEGSSSIAGANKSENGYGLSLGYGKDNTYIGVDYISNLEESDQFSSNDVERDIPGIAIHGAYEFDRFTAIAEYITTSKELKPGDLDDEITTDARPAATHLELNIDLNKERSLAIAWNKVRDTHELEEDDIRKFFGVTYSQPVYKQLSGSIEVAQFTDSEGVQDKSVNVQLVLEF
jgi:hypothetical protein